MRRYINKTFVLYISLIIVVIIEKSNYLLNIDYNDLNNFYYKSFFSYSKLDAWMTLSFMLPIFVQQFFVSKKIYNDLLSFKPRYKNRKRYLWHSIINGLITSAIYTVTFILLQLLFNIYILEIPFVINWYIVIIFIKFIFEMFILNLFGVFISFILKNIVHSFLEIVFIIMIFMNYFITKNIPVISLFIETKFNFLYIVYLFILFFLIRKIYLKIDLGGVDYENND